VTIEQFAYLKTPDKVRAAMINCIGHAPPMSAIEKTLKKIEARKPIRIIGEPTDADGIDYRVNVKPTRTPARSLSQIERRKAAPKPIRKVKPEPVSYQPNEYTKRLVKVICEKMGLDEPTFYSKSRWKEYVMARAIVVKLLRERNPGLYSSRRISMASQTRWGLTTETLMRLLWRLAQTAREGLLSAWALHLIAT
jgi:hypothetical protein